MNKLEELLNKLIEMWWKPRWQNVKSIDVYNDSITIYITNIIHSIYSINDLVSIGSWLWQFIVEQWLCKDVENHYIEVWIRHEDDTINNIADDKYRLMMSSIAEDKVQFILDNIKEIVLDTE